MQRMHSNSGATEEIKANASPECPVMLNYNWIPIEISVTSKWILSEYIMLCDVSLNSKWVQKDGIPRSAEVLQTHSVKCVWLNKTPCNVLHIKWAFPSQKESRAIYFFFLQTVSSQVGVYFNKLGLVFRETLAIWKLLCNSFEP